VSSPEDPDKKPPSQPTVAWNPEDLPPPQPTMPWSADELAKMAAEDAATEAATPSDDPLVGTLMRDKWRILKRLGAGSFGTVYKVQDVKGGWIEALKILGVDRMSGAEAEEMRKRFLREAQIMKRLGTDSQHIVGLATYEEDIEAGLIYFLMEFVGAAQRRADGSNRPPGLRRPHGRARGTRARRAPRLEAREPDAHDGPLRR